MGGTGADQASLIDWAVASQALCGQPISGDLHAVVPFPGGVLVAVFDGLGHGDEAALASRMAYTVVSLSPQAPLEALTARCHDNLKGTRGVVMSLARFSAADDTLEWLGVGNVDGILLRADGAAVPPHEMVPLRSGVVGHLLPPLRTERHPVARGDTVVFATDGIRSAFAREADPRDPPRRMADALLADHCRGNDDALVLVARYLGATP